MPEELKITISADDKTGAPLKSAGNNFKVFANTVKTASVTALKWIRNIVLTLGGLGAYAIKSAYDFAELRDKLGQVFGDGAKDAEKFARDLALATNRSIREITEITSEFGKLFKNSGYAGKELQDLTEKFTKLSLGIEKMAGSPTQAMDAIRMALLGSEKAFRQLGISLTDSEKRMIKVNSIAARSEAIFKILSNKFPNYLKNMFEDNPLQAFMMSMQNLFKEVGEQLIRGFGIDKFFTDINSGINKLIKSNAIEKWAYKHRAIFEKLGKTIQYMLDPDVDSNKKIQKLGSALFDIGIELWRGFFEAVKANSLAFAVLLATPLVAEIGKQLIAQKIASMFIPTVVPTGSGTKGAEQAGVFAIIIKAFKWILAHPFVLQAGLTSTKGTPAGEERRAKIFKERQVKYENEIKKSKNIPTTEDIEAMKNKRNEMLKNLGKKDVYNTGFTPATTLPQISLSPFRNVSDSALMENYNQKLQEKQLAAQKQTRDVLIKYTGITPYTSETK